MVTDQQLLNAVNSLQYRRRLEDGIFDLESIVHKYLNENKLDQVSIEGYRVYRNNGSIIIKDAPIVNLNQLEMKFENIEN